MDNIIISNLVGYLLGDGWISIGTNIKGSTYKHVGFSGDVCDLELIKKDLIDNVCDIGKSKIQTYNTFSEKYNIKGTSNYFVANTKCADFFIGLSLPYGKRVEKIWHIPEWIMNGNDLIKSSFLSGLYAAEGLIPSMQRNDVTPKVLSFCFTKREELKDNMYELIEQFSILLGHFNIGYSYKIVKTVTCDNNLKCIFSINNTTDNLLKFINIIDNRYCLRKQKEFNILKQYLLLKKKIVLEKEKAYYEYINKILTCKEISEKYGISINYIYKWKDRKPNNAIPNNFIKYTEFKNGSL